MKRRILNNELAALVAQNDSKGSCKLLLVVTRLKSECDISFNELW